MIIAPRADHGTRACYVGGCRCDECRAANATRARERTARARERANEVMPTGPAIPSTMQRGTVTIAIVRCPGAAGAACVVAGGTWLNGATKARGVCAACVVRATVWDGVVSSVRVRRHLRKLSKRGVGYKAVAAACDVAASTLGDVLAGEPMVRASTERRVLAVDTAAIADGALVDATTTNARIAAILARGFTRLHVAELLGCVSPALQLGGGERVTAATRARVERLWRRVDRGELEPRQHLVDVADDRAWLLGLLERGVPESWLSRRLGFEVRAIGSRMRPARAARVRGFRAEVAKWPAEWARDFLVQGAVAR